LEKLYGQQIFGFTTSSPALLLSRRRELISATFPMSHSFKSSPLFRIGFRRGCYGVNRLRRFCIGIDNALQNVAQFAKLSSTQLGKLCYINDSARNLLAVTDEAVCICEIASLEAADRNVAMTVEFFTFRSLFCD
jgi:hypothetical protein